MGDFRMPSLGADMEAATIVEWRVKPGAVVHRGDIVAVVETEKSTIEIEVFEDGLVQDIVVPEGEKVAVGTVLARIGTAAPAGAAPESTLSPVVRHLAADRGVELTELRGSGVGGTVTRADVEHAGPERSEVAGRVRASPLARRRAHELGVELDDIAGTGPGGTTRVGDVERAAIALSSGAPDQQAERASPTTDRPTAMRNAIAALMARSKREVPHYYLSTTIDMSRAVGWLERHNLDRPVTERVLASALLLKATAVAALAVPEMNGFWLDGGFRPSSSVHLGVAISLREGGLLAPAIHDADRISLDELMQRLRDLVGRARHGSLRSSEMSDPTITVTNLGDQGVEVVFGVIYPPQVALVGVGKVVERPWAANGMIGVRPVVTVTLSADHRASDGHRGATFLAAIDRLLQEPDAL